MNSFSSIGGNVRPLTFGEKVLHPKYTYVVTSRFSFRQGSLEIEIPKGFLVENRPWGNSWIFRNYLYKTHFFSSGQICSRQQADELCERVRKREGHNLHSWLILKLSRWDLLGTFKKEWDFKGSSGPKFLGYEGKKLR